MSSTFVRVDDGPMLEVIPVGRWCQAIGGQVIKGGKTRSWAIYTAGDQGTILGEVRWYSAWRRYAFYPHQNTVYERDCLRALADFCDDKTRAHSEERRARGASSEG